MTTNNYFDDTCWTPLPRFQTARAEAVNAIVEAIVVGFNKVPSAAAAATDSVTYCVDTGAANAYVIAPTTPILAYAAGMRFSFKAVNANTMASTVNVSGIGIATIKRQDGNDLAPNDITAGRLVWIQYDGANFQLMSLAGSDVVTSGANAAAAAASAATASTQAGITTGAATSATASAGTATAQAGIATTQAAAAATSAAAVAAAIVTGAWVPTLVGAGGGSAVLAVAVGSYLNVGNRWFATATITLSSVGTLVGAVQIGNLPWTQANVANDYGECVVTQYGNVDVSTSYLLTGGSVAPNTKLASLMLIGFAAGQPTPAVVLPAGELTNTSTFHVTLTGHT